MPTKENPNIVNPNPLVDTSKTTADAYIKLKNKGLVTSANPNKVLGETDTKWYTSPVLKSQVYVYTPLDKQQHKYWTSMNIDVQVQDFMGTCELHAPYDSDLMAYWQPIAQFCIVYGSNNGPAKVLFVGRVREVKQDGYECVVTLQNYGWKFQQDAPAKFVQDNVTNKDGLTIIKNIFEALRITGYTISENAAKRLKEVGINQDGNLTLNGKEIEEMPDLLERLKKLGKADMTKIMGKDVITEKEKEDTINWKDVYNLNYTLKYSEPTAVMTQLNDSSNYKAGNNVYNNVYSGGGNTASNVASTIKTGTQQTMSAAKKEKSRQWTEIAKLVEIFFGGVFKKNGAIGWFVKSQNDYKTILKQCKKYSYKHKMTASEMTNRIQEVKSGKNANLNSPDAYDINNIIKKAESTVSSWGNDLTNFLNNLTV